jgi:mRNA interferase MazF
MKNTYIPDCGDLVWMDLDTTFGKEQQGRRPVVVITPKAYNQFGLCITVPVTTKIKGYNTEVALPATCEVDGVVLSNHPRSHDWKKSHIKFIKRLDNKTVHAIQLRLKALLCI